MTNRAPKWEKRFSRENSIKHRLPARLFGPRIGFCRIWSSGRDVKMPLLVPRASRKAMIRETGFATKCSEELSDTFESLFMMNSGSPGTQLGRILRSPGLLSGVSWPCQYNTKNKPNNAEQKQKEVMTNRKACQKKQKDAKQNTTRKRILQRLACLFC